ncbi:hypothetical protein [Streptomyces sp. NTK 937]|uniref:hypothetical protein n=1 Tax=Streptomyces sp. NTK 937 TaxID=1487711 RepID=UPI0004A948C1|nr:hypothetical protein [Streptomyces sp. NTK 937]KDQ65662.1 hypothetical protein DT87_32840 [Streptomyces sp. NTK 937]KDQ65700.1 hypothetical protein DT87_00130 [Streptomyces sp. NTK 937]
MTISAPQFDWVERAAQRRAERLASPPVNVIPPKPVGPVCGQHAVLWPDAESIDVVCRRPVGHDSGTEDTHIEHEDEGLTWCTPVDRPTEEPSTITADEVRAIVREEIREAFKVLAAQADDFPGYETDTIEDSAASMLQRVAEGTVEILRHAPSCKLRDGGRWSWDCDCGVKD